MGGVFYNSGATTAPTQANVSSIPCSTDSVVLLSYNTARKGIIVYNNAIYNMFLKFGSNHITAENFTILIGSGATYESPTVSFGGIIYCAWDQYDATGSAHVTEMY